MSMDLNELRKSANEHLSKVFKNYEIRSITHTLHTNVCTVTANSDITEIILTLDYETGEMLDMKKYKKYVVSIVEEPIPVYDTIGMTTLSLFDRLHKFSMNNRFICNR